MRDQIGDDGIQVLVRFARLASETGRGSDVLPLVADALVDYVGADAVAVVEIGNDGKARFITSPHLPRELEALAIEPDAIGEELESQLLAACDGRFAQVRARPLVSRGGLFGSVVMFFKSRERPQRLDLAEGLVDLAAITLGSSTQIAHLAESHAELRASQEVLFRSEKMRALGEMAAGVSHDLKNILNPLSLHLQLIERALTSGDVPGAQESAAVCRRVLKRGVETIDRLGEYSRQSPESPHEPVDLNRLVHEASELACPRMVARGGRLTLVKEELGSPSPILARSGEIVSALVNLLVNAIDATQDGGTITLRTGEQGSESWVQVADDGPGMPPEVKARVFEPFFTTKGVRGSGLGLAMVYASVQRHGGSIELETAPGRGTTFTLKFPRAPLAKV